MVGVEKCQRCYAMLGNFFSGMDVGSSGGLTEKWGRLLEGTFISRLKGHDHDYNAVCASFCIE